MDSEERVHRLWVVPIAVGIGSFFAAMVWYAGLGSDLPESYSSIMLGPYLLVVGTFMLVDILSRRRYGSPTIIVGALTALSCFITLPLVRIHWMGFSIGFILATAMVSIFVAVFFYIAFFTD